MKPFFVFLYLLFFSASLSAQSNQRIINAEILSSSISADESLLACSTADSVFILNVNDWSLVRKWAHHQETPIILGFHPGNNNILLLQQQRTSVSLFSSGMTAYGLALGAVLDNYKNSDRKYNEQPEDSISLWDISKASIANKSPGNFYFQFGRLPNSMVAVNNNIYSYQSQGKLVYASRKAEILTINGESRQTTSINKSCRKLVLSADQRYFAASWRDGYENDTLYFSLGIHDAGTHEALYTIDHLKEPVSDLSFSPDGNFLAFADNAQTKEKGALHILDLAKRSIIRNIEGGGGAMDLKFSKDGKQLYYLDHEKRDWAAIDLETGRIIHKVWAALVSANYLLFTSLADDKLVFASEIHSFNVGEPIGKTKTYLLGKYDLKDMAVFTRTKEENSTVLYDSSAFLMLMNDVPVNNNEKVLNFNADRSFFTRVDNKTQLQVWNTVARKKIFQTGFEAQIHAAPDRSGKNILVVENNVQRSYSEFQLHLVAIGNGLKHTSPVLERSATIMDGSYYQLKLVADPMKDNCWYALDGSKQVWEINGPSFTMKKLVTLQDASACGLEILPNGDLYILGKTKENKYSVWKWKTGNSLEQLVFDSPKSSMRVLKQAIWMWNFSYSGDSTIEVWSAGTKQKTITIHGKIQQLDGLPGNDKSILHYEVKGKNKICYYENENAGETVALEQISINLYYLRPDELLAEEEGFSSLLLQGKRALPWTVKTPLLLDISNFDVSANGNFVLLDNRIIDLKDIRQWDIYKYSRAALLQDTTKLSWVELYRESGYGTGRGGFTLYKFREGNKDTIKSKTWINEPKTDNFYFCHDQLIPSPDKQWAISFVQEGMLNKDYVKAPPMLWDLKKMEGIVIPVKAAHYSLAFSADGKRIISRSWQDNKSGDLNFRYDISVYQVSPFKLIRSRKDLPFEKLNDPAEGEQFTLDIGGIQWLQPSGDSLKVKKTFFSKQDIRKFCYSAGTKKIIAGSSSGNLIIWDINGSASPSAIITAHSAPIRELMLRNEKVYTLADNGEIGITDLKEDKLKVMVRTLVKENELRVAMHTPEGYYRVDPDLMKDLQFIKNGDVYPLSSFELQGNRPDKVYEALGLADTSFISILKESWKNRIRKAGFDPETKLDESKRPMVKWDRSSLPVITNKPLLPVLLEIGSGTGSLKTLHIQVNGVPVGSKKGKTITGSAVTVNEDIPLIIGNNSISVLAINEQGMESLEQDLDIVYAPDKEDRKRKLVFAGIGVSDYADSSMNLHFAAKDIQDISERLRYYFDTVELYTLTNSQATRENIIALKNKLKQTGLEDMVMVSFSGHGVIEPDKGFYFAPYDMNFSKPSTHGVSMEMIDELLDDIPARRRLLLLDACHSGEQWEGVETGGKLPEGVTAIKPRGGVTTSTGESANGNKLLGYQLMKELFSDFSRGNGAFMISAAASNEFAFEGEQWNNGVFTKSLLEALAELRYKGSYGKIQPVPVRELRKLIYQKVSNLTNGRQNPTSRQENGWWNWSF